MSDDAVFDIRERPVHLGLGATVVPQELFDGMAWYERYSERTAADGAEGRLVSMHSFDADWDAWEMHPAGEELVICIAGEMVVHQEHADGTTATVALTAGQAVVNPAGTWHVADVSGTATAVFVTAGLGTEHRPR